MLCLSGFELYSRWVPLDQRDFEEQLIFRITLLLLNITV